MATLTYTTEGRTVTLINRTVRSLAAVGGILSPGESKTVKLADIQGNNEYMNALNDYESSGLISVVVNSGSINPTLTGRLDGPLDPRYQAARDVFTAPPAADVDAIKLSFLAPAVATNYSGTDLDGGIGTGNFDPQRNFTVTGTTGAGEALDGGDFIITGLDLDQQIMVETLTVAGQGANLTVTTQGVYAFKWITNVLVPLDTNGANRGNWELGFGNKLGFYRPLTEGGLIGEFQDNVSPPPGGAGTVVVAGTGLPNGTYLPSQAPNGTRVWICVYCPDTN